MQESLRAAVSYIRAQAGELNIPRELIDSSDLHVHVPAGAIPKDGPSAGITMATAIVSALRNQTVREDVAMTGEITLSGLVLPVGGIREKALAARRHGVKVFILPARNEADLAELPPELKAHMTFVPVQTLEENALPSRSGFSSPVITRHLCHVASLVRLHISAVTCEALPHVRFQEVVVRTWAPCACVCGTDRQRHASDRRRCVAGAADRGCGDRATATARCGRSTRKWIRCCGLATCVCARHYGTPTCRERRHERLDQYYRGVLIVGRRSDATTRIRRDGVAVRHAPQRHRHRHGHRASPTARARTAINNAVSGEPVGPPVELVILPLSDGYHLAYRGPGLRRQEIFNVAIDANTAAVLRQAQRVSSPRSGRAGAPTATTRRSAPSRCRARSSPDDGLRPSADSRRST
jgi:hypothetical protein